MKKIYLDNAATTPIDSSVIEVMQNSMQENFGNPSSSHQFGRKAKNLVENARNNIAKLFHVSASEIIFTAGGTEADNLILYNAVTNLGVQRIISSKIEHHAVSHTIVFLQDNYQIDVDFVELEPSGDVSIEHLEYLLKSSEKKTMVSLMYINNEIGNILPINKICNLCIKYKALFHSDTVQAIGHYAIDLQKLPIDFIVASAHKFHGPKGVGFAYFKKGLGIQPLFHGGNQEKGARSSTENVHGIVGMEKALVMASETLEKDKLVMNSIKSYFIDCLKELNSEIRFNGNSANLEKSSCTILNVSFPASNDMLIFNLDLHGIAVSGGSACQSGSNKGSHVLHEILIDDEEKFTSVRFSFSRFTTKSEINYTIEKLKKLL
ncbi:MAG: Cysteine desulfurase IscS [Flavobacterium sp. SCGC AAA160-P02]|nr:MAG: Cysteine desulfurase IscS [Flavobacterium sp. SCGC AAA160-P02]